MHAHTRDAIHSAASFPATRLQRFTATSGSILRSILNFFKEYFQLFCKYFRKKIFCVDPSAAHSTTETSNKAESVSTAGPSKHVLCL